MTSPFSTANINAAFQAPVQIARTSKLDLAYFDLNPQAQRVIVLVHGWPDSPETWKHVAPALVQAGCRVLIPSLRGYGHTQFLNAETMRSGQLSALGRDLVEFIDAMGLKQPALVGHDWGARAVANACGLRPGIASHLVMVSVGYGTNDPQQALSYAQAQRYWYHWFMATARGEQAVKSDGKAFARQMWDTWAAPGWYSEADFQEAARYFENPDWPAVVLSSYRHRWGHAPGDASYAEDEKRLHPAPRLSVPTLILHGANDPCNPPESSAGKESFFSGRYERVLIEQAGHFPQREKPELVSAQLVRFCLSP